MVEQLMEMARARGGILSYILARDQTWQLFGTLGSPALHGTRVSSRSNPPQLACAASSCAIRPPPAPTHDASSLFFAAICRNSGILLPTGTVRQHLHSLASNA
jgi:hypothetical protein